MLDDARKIDIRLDRFNAEGFGMTHRGRRFARGEQRFGGYTAIVEAIAPHLAAFHQNDRYAESSGGSGNGQSARTTANNADIGFQLFRHGNLQSGRPIGDEKQS